jgi:membrane peptidoglycan carboxypeptidase
VNLFKKILINSIRVVIFLIVITIAFYGLFSVTLSANKHADLITALPDISKIKEKELPASTLIFDRGGNLIYEIYGDQRRYLAASAEIPFITKNTFVSIEDKDFWRHAGLSFSAILRAAKTNAENQKVIQGGSTITQQLVKNSILSPENSLERKVKEAILASQVEKGMTKDEIISRYLNQVSFGSNIYGVKTASKIYFGKELKDLTIAENAILAAIVEAPSYYYPYGEHRKELLKRKDLVLQKMFEQGYIDRVDYNYALSQKIEFKENKKVIKFPYFSMYVRDELFKKYGEDEVKNGGLVVQATIDPTKQKIAEESIGSHIAYLLQHNAENSALVAADPKTGQILSMVGGTDYNQSNVNVATAYRQPGSSFKPIVYLVAFENGYAPDTSILDMTRDFGGGYVPKNFDGVSHGWTPLKFALGNSYNISAVRTISKLGVDPVLQKAQKMGLTELDPANDYGYSLALGSASVRLLDMVQVYSVLSQNGQKINLTPFIKIKNQKNNILEDFSKPQKEEIADPNLVRALNGVLSNNNNRMTVFGWNNSLVLSRPAAAKTGTTNDYRDALTLGYTPNLVCGVWVGNNDNHPMDQIAGALGAAPIWHDFMEQALQGMPVEEFQSYDLKPKDSDHYSIY